MFRELKFDILIRTGETTWDRKKLAKLELEPEMIATDTDGLMWRVDWDNVLILQYTGMFDKNGTPVYHASVLKNKEDKCYEVFYGFGAFFIVEDEESDRIMLTDNILRNMEVVGDVFNNAVLTQKPISEKDLMDKINNNEQNNQN